MFARAVPARSRTSGENAGAPEMPFSLDIAEVDCSSLPGGRAWISRGSGKTAV